jgi:high-affinity nickel-transport protein
LSTPCTWRIGPAIQVDPFATLQPLRKLYYNMTITLVSVIVAALVAGLEAVGLVGGRFGFTGYLWEQVKALNSHFNTLGFAIIGLFALAWTLSWVIYRAKRLDQCEVRRIPPTCD